MYSIYKITSPSGRFYIGVTRQPVRERWRMHVYAAYTRSGWHPFRDAIRKYGEAAFIVETLITAETEDAALAFEKCAIHNHGAVALGYNISEGGEYDWQTGVARLAELRKDPEFDRRYRKALSDGSKASAKTQEWVRGGLAVISAAWKKDNPKQVWYTAYRASRLAARAAGVPPHVRKDPRFSKGGRLWIPSEKVHLARKGFKRSERAARMWARRSAEQRQSVSKCISKTIKALHAQKTPAERTAHLAQLSEARKSIDHTKRKANQKAALAAYWTPERRQAKREAMRAVRAKQLEGRA